MKVGQRLIKPWNRGALLARPWRDGDETRPFFARFAGGSCEGYASLTRRVFYPTSGSPHLSLQVLRPVPEEYLRFAGP